MINEDTISPGKSTPSQQEPAAKSIRLFQIDTPVRFDIITVVGNDGNFKVEHIEEAFYPPLY